MPTLVIGDQRINVDDSFRALTVEQQQATVEEIAKSLAPPTTAAAPASMAGASGADVGRFGMTAAVRGLGAAADFLADPLAPLRRLVSPSLERIEQSGRPRLGQAAGNAVFAATGIPEYQPTTAGGRMGLAAAEGLVGGAPFGFVPAALSAVGGGLGQGVMEAAPKLGVSPDNAERLATVAGLLPAAVTPLARGVTNYAARQARETLGPNLSQNYREGLVGEELRAGATDPEMVRQKLAEALGPRPEGVQGELVRNSVPTLYQLTEDTGIGQMERGQSRAPGQSEPFVDRGKEQAKARVEAVQGIAPETATPGAVGDLFRQRLARVDAEGEANIGWARDNATQALAQSGGALNREDYGVLIRDQLEAAKTATKKAASGLWQAVDPEGKLTIDGTPVREAAAKITGDISKMARQPEGTEAEVFNNARMLGAASPFSDFTALRGNLLQAIRDERINGETPALRRMQQLRAAMDDAIAETANKAAEADPTIGARLVQQGSEFGGTAAEAAISARGGGGAGPGEIPFPAAQASSGVLGTAGEAGRGPGGAAGTPRVPEPPRPQDLIQFLRSRGGLALDDGGELRAMDLDKGRGFARLTNPKGMTLDEARELAVESGYLHPDSDINDLLFALHRTQGGQPVFNVSNPESATWLEFDRARRSGAFEGHPPLPGAPANFDAAAAGRYRAAADAWRDMSERFKNQIVGPVLAERGSEYRMLESRVPEQFIARPEGVKAFLDAGGDRATLADALVADLRRSAAPDGVLDVRKYQAWLTRRDGALRGLPEARTMLDNAAGAQASVDGFIAGARQARQAIEQSAARYFLNAEPTQAVQTVLGGKNPVGDMAELVRMTQADPAAAAGLQRAVADYIERNFIGNADALKSDAFQTFVNRSGPALQQVFSPEQMATMKAIAADLKRSNLSVSGSKLPGGSDTAQNLALQQRSGSVWRHYLNPGTAAGAVGLGVYLIPGAGWATAVIAGSGAGKTMARLRRVGLDEVNALRTEALLNPQVAAALLMKATPANRPFIAAKLNSALGRIVGAGAATENLEQPARRGAR